MGLNTAQDVDVYMYLLHCSCGWSIPHPMSPIKRLRIYNFRINLESKRVRGRDLLEEMK
jgi:hypothetical protein